MSSTTTSHNRVDPNIKRDADQIIKDMGITISDAHELFYRQIIANQGLPFFVAYRQINGSWHHLPGWQANVNCIGAIFL
ncbi:RelB antitoxin [Desulfonatronospira thiodismutans ASO3-1]|uniref:RelB antitoxin n=1 Tax=Desulfonatronospira thiodismutans ASO3-1 TaxID=555779 RepID=D6SM72_9BACT|nr:MULTISPECIES: type II toxin-antitoxin system RelB/DinJ family antitoxin [Desulfonatronospira]EFI35783.1 RelB antitoxin [Desulfonatronospira thiodismutans ASO3-1]RQD77345.1 MAG: type II toxin-antitoxin system RelB/DinJ family antitoxin [Desulfonatronospira sp. MSAO_Bac3]